MKVYLTAILVICMCTLPVQSVKEIMSRDYYKWLVSQKYDRVNKEFIHNICLNNPSLKSCELAVTNPDKLSQLTNSYKNKANYLYITDNKLRRKRSANEFSRSKREIPGNPCTVAYAIQTVILYAERVDNGMVAELVQDSVNNYYQTFYTFECVAPYFWVFQCISQNMVFIASVFTGEGIEAELTAVEIPATCGILVEY